MSSRLALLPCLLACAGLLGCDASDKGTDEADAGTTSPTDGGGGGGGDDGGEDGGGDDGGATDPYVDRVQAACPGGEEGAPALIEAVRLTSTVTWTLDFDADAEAAGWTDCHYTREFEGVQRFDLEHVCPHCETLVEGDAVMIEGFTDCAEPLFGGEPTRTETWGFDGADIYRRTGSQLPMTTDPLTTADAASGDGTPVAVEWESEYGVNDESGVEVGRFELSASGTVAWAPDPTTLVEEPYGPRADAYACGWECNDPGGLGGSYPLAPDAVLPNFRMRDQCGELVDIHDFYGSYLVLDSAQSDCGPCLAMAGEAEAFRDQMTELGIPVRLIPLLGNGLSDVAGTPDTSVHDAWVERFDPSDPVLADNGWGYAALGQYLADHEGTDIAWPAWIIIGPDMQVVTGAVGFGSWDTMGSIIREDWAARGETGPL